MATKKKTNKRRAAGKGGARVNKSEWIRQQSPSMSAADVVAKGAKQGISLTIGQAYTARSNAKRAGSKLGTKSATRVSVPSASAEVAFIEAVGELGLARSQLLLNALKRL